jgi:cation:H+ antiporter
MLISLILYILSFIAIWFGAGIVIKSVDKIAHRLRLSSFAVSFFVLGILTSIPEAAVSINAVIDKRPEVFVGTLLGGIIVIFLFIIPLLAILGKGVKLNHSLDNKSLIGLLAVIAAPGLVVIDHKVTNFEGILLVLAYVVIFYFIQRKHGFLQENNTEILSTKSYSFLDLAKVAAGIGIVFISSRFIVSQTLSFAEILNIPAFYISIIVLSLGANIPEISIAVRAIISGKKDIAFGDYLGSAASNVLLFGIFTLVNDGEVFTFDSFIITFLFIASGLGLFYYFAQSKEEISKKEGFILLGIYVIFVLFEIGNGLFG